MKKSPSVRHPDPWLSMRNSPQSFDADADARAKALAGQRTAPVKKTNLTSPTSKPHFGFLQKEELCVPSAQILEPKLKRYKSFYNTMYTPINRGLTTLRSQLNGTSTRSALHCMSAARMEPRGSLYREGRGRRGPRAETSNIPKPPKSNNCFALRVRRVTKNNTLVQLHLS
jgi:hypothetical protein